MIGTNAKRVVHMTSVHSPVDGRIFEKECKTLAAAGYDVTIIAPTERNFVADGVRIKAVRRLETRFKRMTITPWALYRAALKERADVYHFHDPELTVIALLLKIAGKRVIWDLHEDVPADILSKEYLPRKLRGLLATLAKLVQLLTRNVFDASLAATPRIASNLSGRKTVVIRNYPIVEQRELEDRRYTTRPKNAIYIGSISRVRGISEMVKAMGMPSIPHDSRLVIAGEF